MLSLAKINKDSITRALLRRKRRWLQRSIHPSLSCSSARSLWIHSISRAPIDHSRRRAIRCSIFPVRAGQLISAGRIISPEVGHSSSGKASSLSKVSGLRVFHQSLCVKNWVRYFLFVYVLVSFSSFTLSLKTINAGKRGLRVMHLRSGISLQEDVCKSISLKYWNSIDLSNKAKFWVEMCEWNFCKS